MTRTDHSDDAIRLSGVTKTFGPKIAVDRLDLVVPRGGLYGFIGPNGAGKTTSIRMIMSILFPDRGEVSVLGHASALDAEDRIGYLPEERGLYKKKMKVLPFLRYMAHLKGVEDERLDTRINGWPSRCSDGALAWRWRGRCSVWRQWRGSADWSPVCCSTLRRPTRAHSVR